MSHLKGKDINFSQMEQGMSNLDAQRMISILNEVERKIELINLLPPKVDKKVQGLFSLDTVSLITEFRQLELKFQQSSDSVEKAQLQERLKKLTRAVYRHFLSDPQAFAKLKQLSAQTLKEKLTASSPNVKETPQETFGLYISQFKNIIHEKLKISVEQELKKQEALEQITLAEKKMRSEIEGKRLELKKLRETRDSMNREKGITIAQLKEQLRNIRKSSEEANRKLEMKAKQKENAESTIGTEKTSQLSLELGQLQQEHKALVEKNREEEAQLRRRRAKFESDVEHWILKYDTDMSEKQVELDELLLIYNDEHSQLEELRSRYNVLKQQEAVINDEKARKEEIKRQKVLEFQRLNKAASRIQALYRGYNTRKKLKKGKEKKGKK